MLDAPRTNASLEQDPLSHESSGALVPRRYSLKGLGRDSGEAVSDRQDDALFHSRVDLFAATSSMSLCAQRLPGCSGRVILVICVRIFTRNLPGLQIYSCTTSHAREKLHALCAERTPAANFQDETHLLAPVVDILPFDLIWFAALVDLI